MADCKFETVGLMIDVSRNAVMSIEGWRRFLPLISEMGYNAIFLYMEDVYEVIDEPFFGYMRGRYTLSELSELESLGEQYGIEMIPCIQTLAHLDQIFRWKVYPKDNTDILMVGDERTYQLIDNMFKTLSTVFKSRRIHVGMDEAGGLGRGKYHDVYGCQGEDEIMRRHLMRVKEIAESYGYEIMMWSDMFFRGWNNGSYYCEKTEIPESYRRALPEGVIPVHWDYYMPEEKRYDDMLENHKQLSDNVWFAGGVWTWIGFAPSNAFTLKTMLPAIEACKKHGVKNLFFTLWGDYGAECSRFSVLPSLFYLSEVIRGNDDPISIKLKFKERFGIDYDQFCTLDLPNRVAHDPENKFECENTSKYMLYSDCLQGHLDFTVMRGEGKAYGEIALKIKQAGRVAGEYGYLFDTLSLLSEILSYKYELGVKTREAYRTADKRTLYRLAKNDYSSVIKLLPRFIKTFKKQWLAENKYSGFDVQEYRLGGLLTRMKGCRDRILDYVKGRIDSLEELECEVMPYGEYKSGVASTFYHFLTTFTSNLVD